MKKLFISFLFLIIATTLASCALSFKQKDSKKNGVKFTIDLEGGMWSDEDAITKANFIKENYSIFYKEIKPEEDETLIEIGLPGYDKDKEICYKEVDGKKYYLNYFTDDKTNKKPFDLYEINKDKVMPEPKQISKDLTLYAIYNDYPGPSRIKNKNMYYQMINPTPSIGRVKFLVIPVIFDSTTNSEDFKNRLNAELTKVSEFYQLSSNNNFNPEFIMPDPFKAADFKDIEGRAFTKELLQQNLNENTSDGVGYDELELLKKIIDEKKDILNIDTSFDQDGDGILDGILFVYDIKSEPQSKTIGSTKVFSPFYSIPKVMVNELSIPNNGNNKLLYKRYGWLSGSEDDLNSLNNFAKHNEIIRQIGFMMGLDYYTFKNTEKKIRPLLPCLDPMFYGGLVDYNLISKIMLGWVEADIKQISDEKDITNWDFIIGDKPLLLTKSKDFKTYFQEYYLITKHNHLAAENNFFKEKLDNINLALQLKGEKQIPRFTKNGYLVYHVDFRLNNTSTNIETKSLMQLAYSNTSFERNETNYYYLLNLVDKLNQNKLINQTSLIPDLDYNELLYDNTNNIVNNLTFYTIDTSQNYTFKFNNNQLKVIKN